MIIWNVSIHIDINQGRQTRWFFYPAPKLYIYVPHFFFPGPKLYIYVQPVARIRLQPCYLVQFGASEYYVNNLTTKFVLMHDNVVGT